MSLRPFVHRLQSPRSNARRSIDDSPSPTPARRSDRRRPIGRACCEALEDRRLMSFTPAASYPAGELPQDVVTADFNGDGRLDLAVADWWSSAVSVLPGNADGTFQAAQAAQTSATGAEPLSVAVGDFDADGRLDLATANEYDVSVLRGNGDGTFQPPTSISMGVGDEPASVAVGDFNGDGALDLGVTANRYGGSGNSYHGTANVLLGNGDGSFQTPISNFLDWGIHTDAVVADFNGDGVQDFAAANMEDWGVTVLLGDGQGNTLFGNSFPISAPPQAVTAGDVNGDLKTDLVTANRDGSVSVLLGGGVGGFAAARNYPAGGGRDAAAAVVLGDFNGDAKLDIAAGGSHVSILHGSGDGTFLTVENFDAGPGANGLAAGDFNGDGWLDVATANPGGGTVSVLINDRTWPTPPLPSVFISDAAAVTEGNSGTVNATFTVSLSSAAAADVTVQYNTANFTATAGSDYAAASGTVTIPAGQTSGTFTVAVLGDRLPEPAETFAVNLTSATNATIADGQGIGTILDDEPRIRIGDVTKYEGRKGTTYFAFTVTLAAAYDQAVTVSYATAGGTATAGTDYTSTTGSVTFAPGETIKTITVAVLGDKQREANETFFVDLFGASGNSLIGVARGVGTIFNDD